MANMYTKKDNSNIEIGSEGILTRNSTAIYRYQN
jgi:hypothetical protein